MNPKEYLVIKFEPYLGPTVKTILNRFNHLIVSREQVQEGDKVRRTIGVNWPDGGDEGQETSTEYSIDEMVRQLKGWGVSVERQTA